MSKSTTKRAPGRPPVYTPNMRRHIVALAKQFGISMTTKILRAENGTELANRRSQKLFPNPVMLSQPTVKAYATAAGLTFQKGRPSKLTVEAREKGKATASQPIEAVAKKPKKSRKPKAEAVADDAMEQIQAETDANAALAAVENNETEEKVIV